MEGELTIEVQRELKSGDMSAIVAGLTDFNASRTGGDTPNYLLITIRDQDSKVVGGLFGATYLGWLQVQAVWLPDTLRGQGWGTILMRRAEEEALSRNCPQAFVETFSFQALPFYEKLGYRVVSRIPDFPVGGARYALTKTLSAGLECAREAR